MANIGPTYGRTQPIRPANQKPANVKAGWARESVEELIRYDQRPRPSIVYPQQREARKIEGGFAIDFPELKPTPSLKRALLRTMESGVKNLKPRPTFSIVEGDRGGIELRMVGNAGPSDLPYLTTGIMGMLQANLTSNEIADLLDLFDGLYVITNNGKGDVCLYVDQIDDKKYSGQIHLDEHQFKCITKLLDLGCVELAKNALEEFYKACTAYSILSLGRDDLGKKMALSQISNQPWAAWARSILDQFGKPQI
jgi:hypothetical protein